MTMDQDQDMGDDGNIDDDEEFFGATGSGRRAARKPNPVIDTSVPLTDEGYGSREWYRYSHEANTFGRKIDSRYVDQTVEFDDAQGFRYYAQQQMYVWKEEEADFQEASDSSGNKIKGFGLSWFGEKVKTLKGSDEPSLGLRKKQSKAKKLWQQERDRAFEKARKAANVQSDEKLTQRQKFEAMKVAHHAFLAQAGDLVELRRGWFLTPMRIRAMVQAPIKPWFMVPKTLLDAEYAEVERLKAENPDSLVPYLYTGCDNDEELITFIRTDPNPGSALEEHQPPAPLRKAVGNFGEPGYFVRRKDEDERAMTLRAHKGAVGKVQTAEAICEQEQKTKQATGYYDHPNFQSFPPEFRDDDEKILAWMAQAVKAGRIGGVTYDRDWASRWSGWLRGYYEDWLTKKWDRWLPSECYSYRNRIYDAVAFFDPSDWSTVADRIWDVMAHEIHVITPPEVVGVYPDIMTDWRPFRDYVAPVQNRRWVVEIFNHWKMTKNIHNSRASEDLENSDIKNARRNSHGGPRTEERRAADDWRYSKLRAAANADPARALTLLGPLWIKRQPWQPMDHDGASISKNSRKGVSLIDGLGKVRNLSSMAGGKEFPEIKLLREKFTTQVRGYRSEYHWLLNDEYATRDPEDAWKNQSGILTFSLLDEANLRLDGAFAHVPHLRLAYNDSPTGRAFTNLSAFIEEMWHNLPPAPIAAKVEEEIESWGHHNMEHWRPELDKLLHGVHRSEGRHGLNKYFTGYYQRRGQEDRVLDGKLEEGQQYRDLLLINRKPRKNAAGVYERKAFEQTWEWVKGWYERSDDRMDDFLYKRIAQGSKKGPGGASGAYNFDAKEASRGNEHAYGLGYGTLAEQDERQMRRVEIGLKATYYQTMKSIIQWLSLRLTMNPFIDFDDEGIRLPKDRVTLDEVKKKVLGAIEGGKLLWVYAEYLLWPRLRKMAPEILNEPFPSRHELADLIDDEFIRQELHFLAGVDSRPSRFELLKLEGTAKTKMAKEEFDEIIEENRGRYQRIIEMRFPEINEHKHSA